MFSKSINPAEYYTGLIAISVAVGFVSHSIAIGFIVLGAGTMVASFFK